MERESDDLDRKGQEEGKGMVVRDRREGREMRRGWK